MTPVQTGIAFDAVLVIGLLMFGAFPLWLASRRRRAGDPTPAAFTVTIEGMPGGSVWYREGAHEHRFDWELAAKPPSIGFVHVPEYARWPEVVPWAPGRREEILRRVATEVERQKSPRCRWDVGEDVIRFYER